MARDQESRGGERRGRERDRDRGRPGKRPQRGAPPWARDKDELDHVVLYGWHPVVEALGNPHRRLRRLLASENAAAPSRRGGAVAARQARARQAR